MKDLDLLKDLGRVAHEDEAAENARWERWEKWSDGELSDQEEAELLALARDSEEDAAALEAFRPLGPEFRTRVLAAIDGETGREKGGIRAFALWLRWATAGLAAAAVAAGVFVARLPAAIPHYTWTEFQAKTAYSRGEESVKVLSPGDSFEATIQPPMEFRPETRLAVACWVEAANEALKAALCIGRRSPNGIIMITGALAPAAGEGIATLWLVLGYEGRLPDSETVRSLANDEATWKRAWIALPRPIEIRAAPPAIER